MKKAIAMILMIAVMSVTLTAIASANEYTWGFGPVGDEQGIDGWWYMYSRDQSNTGRSFNPTAGKNMQYFEFVAWCGPTWGVPESDGPSDTSVYSIWTDVGSIWKQYWPDGNTDPWGRVAPQGLDAAIILKWVPEQAGVYNLKAIMDFAGFVHDDDDKDPVNGCYIYIHQNRDILYYRDFAAGDQVVNATAFDGEVVLAASDALYFSIDPKIAGDSWDSTYEEEVYWSITITRTGDIPADYVPPAPRTGENSLIIAAVAMLVLSTAGAVIIVKKVKA